MRSSRSVTWVSDMPQVYFCATDFYLKGGYRSYCDLFNMAQMAGFPIISVSQIDPQSDNIYIFTPANGETVQGWPQARAQIILWQLEWMLTDEHNTPPGVARVWASDAGFAKTRGFEYVPMGSDDRLCKFIDPIKHPLTTLNDVALLAYQTPRRQVITNQLRTMGLNVERPEGWNVGVDRSMSLLKSRVMVHVHQHEKIQTVAPLRWALAAAHALPMITETVADRGIFGYTHMMMSSYNYLARFTQSMLQNQSMLDDYALALHDLLCVQYSFSKVVMAHV
jgi:hypothetical protein